jgi:BlaI family transcriptional regulator, penicillinase repressor
MSKKRIPPTDNLTRRERQIMDVIYAAGHATANEIEERMPDAPSHATVRTLLRVLLEKGHLKHRQEGRAFIYQPTKPTENAAKGALRRMLDVFFAGSVENAVSGLLGMEGTPPTPEELDRMEQLIRTARKQQQQQTKN